MTTRLRWGILGPGGIAALMVKDLQLVGAPVVAVGSRSRERAVEFAERFDIPNRHGSYDELVADPEVDIIYVATTQNAHAEHAILALNAGKHVLLEKPYTINAVEAQAVVDAAESNGVTVLEAMWTRFLPHMVRIREVIEAGTIGEVRSLVATHEQALADRPGMRLLDPARGGGALLDLGIYPVALAWDLLGAPATTSALGTLNDDGLDLQTSILFRYDNGAHAVLHTQMDGAGANRASIIGSRGRIDIDGVWYTPSPATVVTNDGEVLERIDIPVEGRGMQFQALAMESMIAAGQTETPEITPAESVAIMASLDEIRAQIGLRFPGE